MKKLEIESNAIEVKAEHLLFMLFKTKDWKEGYKVVSSRRKLLKTCGNSNCVNPEHVTKNLKGSATDKKASMLLVMAVDRKMSLQDILEVLKKEFPGEKIRSIAQMI